MRRLFALTGTPGTGKSSVAAALLEDPELRGWRVLEVSEILPRPAAPRTGHVLVDLAAASRRVRQWARDPTSGAWLVVGHLAHLLPVANVILLRCRPRELARRLRSKGVSDEDARANVEAERVDVVLKEAVQLGRTVWEVDTTGLTVPVVAAWCRQVLQGARPPQRGIVDWLATEPPTARDALGHPPRRRTSAPRRRGGARRGAGRRRRHRKP